ncbi:hypothetical protein R69658_08255 [Paraburkholderia aspalathi]|uniref:Uncharacterized protein n=1 Tax=Paraburkholderia aspalathi TaxID=1324617 RepID=A0ABM8TA80_9BURK|nr:hypothetical protein R69658_08255 [Paraburkholderia aspalathi]CAE6876085.1 hypothetical protein R75465_08617 [Paraburkholderia aspalathi]
MRHATIINSASARSMRSTAPNCKASTRQPFFSTLKYISISHLARYQSINSTRSSRPAGMRLVSNRHSTGLMPAGGSISVAITHVTASPHRNVTRFMHSACFTVRAFCPARAAMTNWISPTASVPSTFCQSFSPPSRLRLCVERTSQSAGVPSSSARRISAAISASRSATYTSRVPGNSEASSARRSYPSIQRVLSLMPPRLPLASFGSRAHIQASSTPSPTRSVLTAYVGCTYMPRRAS